MKKEISQSALVYSPGRCTGNNIFFNGGLNQNLVQNTLIKHYSKRSFPFNGGGVMVFNVFLFCVNRFDYGEKFWIIKWKQFTCACKSPKCKYSSETIHKTIEDYNRRQMEEEAVDDGV